MSRFDVLVVGGGPAGLAAALAASECGVSVGLVDENPVPGGQIYRGTGGEVHSAVRGDVAALASRGVSSIGNTSVFDVRPGAVLGLNGQRVVSLEYGKLILAVGGRELFLPFPGWTLPNVMGVGGLQALVKGGLDVRGKRIVVAGSGPLLLAVGAYLKSYGARVLCIAEQAPLSGLMAFGLGLARFPSKISQGFGLMASVGALVKAGSWVERADGDGRLESVRLNGSDRALACDYLACAFGFVPNLELPMLLGCATPDWVVSVDEVQATSVENVFCAGEPTGIGGVDLSSIEGRIAGYAATGQMEKARACFASREKWRSFAKALDRAFALRSELKTLATPETVVCRCEDVRLGALGGWHSGREAKLHTRCGMGPCQGRICGPATRFLYGWEHGSVRSPLVPAPLHGLETDDSAAGNHT